MSVKGKRVLDVGSGSGLLSAYALQAGASKVLGCEAVPELADMSRRALGKDVKVFGAYSIEIVDIDG